MSIDSQKDRITDLHKNLITHILSYLSTKNAVSTSILSTKWKHLYTSLPNLEFHDHASKLTANTEIESHFQHFVRKLLYTNTNKTINKFVISISKKYNSVEVASWINFGISRNAREIILDIAPTTHLILPQTLFTSESLTVLKIETEQNVNIPNVIRFSCLTVLYLGFVYVCVDDSAKQVFIDCPELERLSLIECEWVGISTVTILAPVLKELVIQDYPDCVDDVLHSCVVKFFTDSLGLLELKSNLTYAYVLNNLSIMLVNANLDLILNALLDSRVVQRVEKLLRGIFNVENLILSSHSIVSLYNAGFLSHLATFSNLNHLTINVENNSGFIIKHLMDLFCHLPEIESLVFTNLHLCPLEEHNWKLDEKRLSFLSRLKSVELKNFCGGETELCLVNFLLNNARSLKKLMVIIEESDSKEKMQVVERLRTLRSSAGDRVAGYGDMRRG